MKYIFYIVLSFIICLHFSHSALSQQAKTPVNASAPKDSTTKNTTSIDSTPWARAYAQQQRTIDSTRSKAIIKPDSTALPYSISKDAIKDEVIYVAKDSSWTDIITKKVHLYGAASVDYGPIKVQADSIVIDFEKNIIEAYLIQVKKGRTGPKPTFIGEGNTFTFESMRYNYETKKGEVIHAVTQEGEFNMVGSKTKYISGLTDSLGNKEDDRIYNEDAIITTCNHDPPHFGIRASKMKFVPKKLAVLSVAQLEIEGVPTPLFLPFGFFPLIKGRSSGLIFPSSYDYNEQLGLGFRDVGYYWPLGPYADLKITGDIYTRGSWGIRGTTDYKKLYAYTGNVSIGYRNDIQDNNETGKTLSQTAFSLRVRHAQDSKAHPYRRIGGDINFQTNRFEQRNNFNAASQLNNTISSNFSFTHDMPGTPFRFAAEFRHSQNTNTRIMDITLPNISLRMNTIFPFKPKNVTKENWTHNIALQYNSELRNFVKVADTLLFTQQTLDNLQTGIQHKAGVNTNFRVLKYFNLSPSVNYEEVWLTKQYTRKFEGIEILDTITEELLGYEAPTESFESKFGVYRDFNTAVSLNTQIFGKINGGKGFFRGVRHIVKPNVSFGYRPATRERYQEVVDTDTRSKFNRPINYSRYTNSPFGTLSGGEEQLALSYGISNIIEAKYWSKKDSIEKKIRLFDNIGINGSHNFLNDTLPWSAVSMGGNTTILKGLTNFNFNTIFTPYVYDEKGRITNQSVWADKKRPLDFVSLNGQFTTSITFGRIVEIILGKNDATKSSIATEAANAGKKGDKLTPADDRTQGENLEDVPKRQYEVPSLADWFNNFSFSHALNFSLRSLPRGDTFELSSHTISVSGSIPLTKNWDLNIGNIAYDIKNKALPAPFFGLSRDLHCWQMSFSWSPDYGTYSFFIGVKSSSLSFLKYDYGQRSANSIFSGGRPR